jgi:hypothetical protein
MMSVFVPQNSWLSAAHPHTSLSKFDHTSTSEDELIKRVERHREASTDSVTSGCDTVRCVSNQTSVVVVVVAIPYE